MEKIKKNPDSTPGRPKQELSGRQIQSVQRAVNILNCFTATNPALTLGQISSRLNLNKGTVHGILNTLRNNGYISQNMAGQYMLGAELFNKACLAPDTRKKVCVDHGHDRLQELSDEFQANGTLFSVADGRLLVLDATEPANCAFIVRRATPEISLYGSASGKIALAYLPPKEQKAFLTRAPNSSVFRVVSFAWAGFGAAFGPTMLMALFWKRSNKWGALAGMLTGGVMVFVWKFLIAPLGGVWAIYELLPAFLAALVVHVVVSLLTPAPEKELVTAFEEARG